MYKLEVFTRMDKTWIAKPAFIMLFQTGVLENISAIRNSETRRWFLAALWIEKNTVVCVKSARGSTVREWASLDRLTDFCASCGIFEFNVCNKHFED